jgi:two-component system, OmpR family, alkaline phosphatase synthesis response regulator PhoP
MNVLVIEDDKNISELIAFHLSSLPATVSIVNHGWKGLDEALTGKFDFLILDIMLPGLNGLEICKRIRSSQSKIPILMLSAKAEESDKIEGFELGADDYLTKPFSPGELLARVKSIMRRSLSASKILEKALVKIERNGLLLDLENHQASKYGKPIDLTVKEFELLQLFMQNPGKNFSRQQILDEVWGEKFEGLEHTVNSNINRLRAKIEDDISNPNYIITAWGVGYKFA